MKTEKNAKVNAVGFPTLEFVMDFECEDFLPWDEAIDTFQAMIDSGYAWKLPGVYGRAASNFIEEGLCYHPNGNFTLEEVEINRQKAIDGKF
jgi:hypothetical protein